LRTLTEETDAPSLAHAMVGRPVSLRAEGAALGLTEAVADGTSDESRDAVDDTHAPVLRVEGAVATVGRGTRVLDDLSITVRPGEILGIAGVEGNGQRALGDLLSSLLPLARGSVTVDGAEVSTSRPGAMARAGIGVIPEDRHDSGVVLDMSVAENLAMVDPGRCATRGVIDRGRLHHNALRLIDEFDIQCSGPDAPLWSLSGGNQQRVVLARELDQGPRVLVASQPTRGLDVGAIEYMSERLRAAAASGVAVVLISSELEEILDLADRIAVMYRGRVVGEMARSEVDIERLGLLMGGAAA
jgi:simple sugar transport system ATP-binding protein